MARIDRLNRQPHRPQDRLGHGGHRMPKERHVNLFLVRQAQDIMELRFILAKAGTSLREAISAEEPGHLRVIVVERDGRIVGLIPPRSGLWQQSHGDPNLQVERFVEPRMVICREDDLLSRVLARLRRHGAGAAIVFSGSRPRARDIVGVITKRAIADTVIDSFED